MDKEKDEGYVAHFPTAKVKKMIQNNQDIGKLSNSIPHLMEYSLQIFLNDILADVNTIANDNDYSKITPILVKKVMLESNKYKFLQPFAKEIEDMDPPKRKKADNDNDAEHKESKPRKKKKANPAE